MPQQAYAGFFNTVAQDKQTKTLLGPQIRAEDDFFKAVNAGDIAAVSEMLDAYPDAVNWHEDAHRDSGDETTALMYVARKNDIAMMQLLMDRGAKINAVDHRLASALTHAAACGRIKAVRLLLANGANPLQRSHLDYHGTPRTIAVQRGFAVVADILRQAEKAANKATVAPNPA